MKKIKLNALCAIYNNEFEILMQLRSHDAPILPGYFGFFGGGIEENESPEIAIKREILEELEYTGNFELYKIRYAVIGNFIEKAYVYLNKFMNNGLILTAKEGEKAEWINIKNVSNLDIKIMEHDYLLLNEIIEQLKLKEEYESI